MLKKKIWASFKRIIELFTQKFVAKLSKMWVWDQGSGKNLFWIPDQGEGSKRHRIQDPDLQGCLKECTNDKKVNIDECFQKEFKTRM